MLDDDFLRSLPDDPELAFVELVDYLDEWLRKSANSQNFDAEQKYADTLRAFADEYELDVPFRTYPIPGQEDWWRLFSSDVNYTQNRYRFRHKLGTRMLPGSSVTLNAERRRDTLPNRQDPKGRCGPRRVRGQARQDLLSDCGTREGG